MASTESDAPPSAKVEDYLQSIYSLETEGERVISARLARWMRVTPPTAWATVQRMQRDDLVSIDAKKTIRLTKHGRELAEKVARRHRLSERFLSDILGLGWAEAHDEAHHFEHGVTPVIEQRIFALLGQPNDLSARQPDSRHRCYLEPGPRSHWTRSKSATPPPSSSSPRSSKKTSSCFATSTVMTSAQDSRSRFPRRCRLPA